MENKEILPGIGLSSIKFGMTRPEVEKVLGKPDEQEISSYSDDDENMNDSWVYHELGLDLSFDEDDDWRLVILSVSSEDYTLMGKDLMGMAMDDLMNELTDLKIEDLEIEDMSSEENPDHKLISSEATGLNFWLQDGELEEIQWGPNFIDDDTIDWPK